MLNFIRFILRLFGISETALMEKAFKEVVLKGGSSGKSGGGNPLDILLNQFKDKGLGDVFQSWVGKGPNQLISPEQVRTGLGDETIQVLAKKAGLPPEQVTQKLATLMPTMIDKMTPDGKIETV